MSDTTIVKYEKQISSHPIPPAITTPAHMAQASEARAERKAILKAAEAEKNKVLKPLNAACKAEQDRWKPLETKLEDDLEFLDRAMTAYQTKQQAIADAEAKKIADRVGEGKGKLRAETAVRKLEEIDAPAAVLQNENGGGTGFRPVPCFEVMDMYLLPIDYHLSNDTAIREAMKKGTELPGVRYWVEQRPINR